MPDSKGLSSPYEVFQLKIKQILLSNSDPSHVNADDEGVAAQAAHAQKHGRHRLPHRHRRNDKIVENVKVHSSIEIFSHKMPKLERQSGQSICKHEVFCEKDGNNDKKM
jgi:hypothetical protein